MNKVHPQAEPFSLEGNETVCLLVHGFTTSPSEMRDLGERLNGAGFTVQVPLLPGHGSSPEDLNNTTWEDWNGMVLREAEALRASHQTLFIIGLSMGGLLALKVAAELEGVDGVVTINSPIYLKGSLVPFAPLIKFFRPYIPKKIDDSYLNMKKRDRFAYDDIPVKAFLSMKQLIKLVVKSLKRMRSPLLIFQSETDESIEEKSALVILNQAGSQDKQLVWLQQSSHVATMGPELELISNEIIGFIRQHNGQQ